jgi:hypothetical protein
MASEIIWTQQRMAGRRLLLFAKMQSLSMPSNAPQLLKIVWPNVQLASCAMVLGLIFLSLLMGAVQST